MLGLPRTFWFLWLGQFINRLGGFVMTFLPLFLTEQHHYSTAAAGMVLSLFGVGGLVGAAIGGYATDHFGRRRTLLTALLAGAVVLLVFGFAPAGIAIGFCAFAHGICNAIYSPAVSAAVSDVVAPADRLRAFGYLYWAVNLGFSVAASLGGLLGRHGYHWLFVGDAATNIGFALIAFLFIPETRPVQPPIAITTRSRGNSFSAFFDHRFVAFGVAQFLLLLVFLQVFITLPLAERAAGLSLPTVGLVAAVNGLVIVTVQPLFLRFADDWPAWILLVSGALLVAIGAALAIPAHSLAGFISCMVVVSFGEVTFSAAAPTFVAGIAPVDQRGIYQGANQICWASAALLAPLLGPGGSQFLGTQTMWQGAVVLCLVAAGLHAFGTRRAQRTT